MKEATNLTPVETIEEVLYNMIILTGVSISSSGSMIALYNFIIFGTFGYTFPVISIVALIVTVIAMRMKKKRFGLKNFTLAERIVVLENTLSNIMGEPC